MQGLSPALRSQDLLEKTGFAFRVLKLPTPLQLGSHCHWPEERTLKKKKKENSSWPCVFTTEGSLLGAEYEILIF